MKHTPGPWRIGNPSVANGVQIFHDTDWPLRSYVICTMPESGNNRTANARLMAAAPDLLEACKDVLNALNCCPEWKRIVIYPIDNRLNNAITKAEPK